MDLNLYDAVEVHPVRREVSSSVGQEFFEVTHPDASDVYCWSVYLHLRDAGGVECIADCPTQEIARCVADAMEKQLKGESK